MSTIAPPPNIILIVADDLGYGDLGCFGNPHGPSPHLDRLAAEGVRLTQHYSCSPLCAPARAGLLTGRYNHRTGALSVESNRGIDRIAPGERTLGDLLGGCGYATGMVGKWHNGLFDPRHHPNARGFNEFAGFLNGGMDYWDWLLDYNGQPRRSDGRYLTDVFTEEAVGFIERHRAEPFFLYLAYNAPHQPIQAPDEDVAPFRELAGLHPTVAELYGMVRRMDAGIGRVLEALDRQSIAENTLVVVTSDNGPVLGGAYERFNGPFRGQKNWVLEGGIRVPALVRWPARLPAGGPCHAMTHFCDWAPTLLAAAGQPPAGAFDGVDLLPLLSGGRGALPAWRFWQHNRYWPHPHCNAAAREGDWKLVWEYPEEARQKLPEDNEWYRRMFTEPPFEMPVDRTPVVFEAPDRPPALYDLATDPGETSDLAGSHPARVSRMRAAYDAWFDEVEAERLRSPEAWGTIG